MTTVDRMSARTFNPTGLYYAPENVCAQRELRAEVAQMPSDGVAREWMHLAEMFRQLPNRPPGHAAS